jgi:hypothetical protein
MFSDVLHMSVPATEHSLLTHCVIKSHMVRIQISAAATQNMEGSDILYLLPISLGIIHSDTFACSRLL